MAKQKNPVPGGVRLWVEWGYEIHRLEVAGDDWAQIVAGKKLSLPGEDYSYDGEDFECTWDFNQDERGSLTVSYSKVGGDGFDIGDGYCGSWKDAHPTA